MTEYSEVIKQFKRMCKSVTPIKCTRGECPMGCENIGQCRKVAFERPVKFEEQVMTWAKENPEPVYPTWAEWLDSMVVVVNGAKAVMMRPEMLSPIPADMAEKLGIKPKAGGDA